MTNDFPLRSWSSENCVSFRKTAEEWGGLSNMAGGYPIRINEKDWLTSEALYQALRFPANPEIQTEIFIQKSPMAAKMKSKPFRLTHGRRDWDLVRIEIMYWCLQMKLHANQSSFGNLLLATTSFDIIEESHQDTFWGAKKDDEGRFYGKNVLGCLLMQLRKTVEQDSERTSYASPVFEHCLLFGQRISSVSTQIEPSQNRLFES